MRRRLGGVEGNERLTGATAVLLIALLAVEGITLLFLGRLLSVHVFVGMLLIPPVLLKLGATGYRFMRYYRRRREYTAKGPPPPIMRFLVAPVLVLSTIGVLGTGVLMIAFGRRGMIVGLHKASFVVWAFAFGIHFLVYLRRLPRLVRPDRRTGGAALRAGAIGASLVAGIALASVTFPLARPWLHHFRRDHGEGRAAAAIRSVAVPVATRTTVQSHPLRVRRAPGSPASRALGLPPVGPGPVPGYVLIADRNANKLLIVSPGKRIVWQFPRPGDLRRGQSFSDPDDAFFTPGYRRIVTNEEFNDQIAQIDLRTHRLVWSYGRAGVAGSAARRALQPRRRICLAQPDDHRRRHQELPGTPTQPGPPHRRRDRRRRQLRPRSTALASLAERRDAAAGRRNAGHRDRRLGRPLRPPRSARLLRPHADDLPLRCAAAPRRQRPGCRLQHARPGRR